MEYLPNFYFGSLLLLFGAEILTDWLLRSWTKVTKKEYVLLWATFIAVMLGNNLITHPQRATRATQTPGLCCLHPATILLRQSIDLTAAMLPPSWQPCSPTSLADCGPSCSLNQLPLHWPQIETGTQRLAHLSYAPG